MVAERFTDWDDEAEAERGMESMLEIEARVGAPVMRMIPQSRLHLEAVYQRTLDMGYVRKLKATWVPRAMGVLYVSERADGRLVVIDGQHRLFVFRELAPTDTDPTVNCLVYRGLTPRDEAETFVILNGSRLALRPIQLFKASLDAERPVETAINRLVESLGMRITDNSADGHIACVLTLRYIYRMDGPKVLSAVLDIAHAANGKQRQGYSRAMLRGLHSFLIRFGEEYDRTHLVDALRRTDPDLIIRQARRYAGVSTSPDLASMTGTVIHELYNKGMRPKGRLKDWNDAEVVARLRTKRAYGRHAASAAEAADDDVRPNWGGRG